MSSDPASTKRKRLSDQKVPSSLSKVLERWVPKANFYTNNVKMFNALKKEQFDGAMLMASTHYQDLAEVAPHHVPMTFRSFSVKRLPNGRVQSIGDAESILQGRQVERVQAIDYLNNRGCGPHLLAKEEEDCFSLLTFDATAQVVTPEFSGQETNVAKEVRILYTARQKIFVYAPKLLLLSLIKLPVPLEFMKPLSEALNRTWINGAYEPKLDLIGGLAGVVTLLKDDMPRSQRAFLEKLLAALVARSNFEDKLEAFKVVPSASLAVSLGFKKPYLAPLYDRTSGQKVGRVSLEALAGEPDDPEIYISGVTVDQKWVETMTARPEQSLVYKADPECGIRKSNKWQQLAGVTTMKASTYLAFLNAISAANDSKNAPEAMDALEEGDDNRKTLAIDELS